MTSADARVVAGGLTFPTGLAFDERERLHVVESGLNFSGPEAHGRLLRLDNHGRFRVLTTGLRAPVNGLTRHEGAWLVAEGGNPGRLSRIDDLGNRETILDGLPGGGNYHTNMIAVGLDGKLYFGQGAATNSGVVGPDGRQLSWLKQTAHPHDIPGYTVTLSGWSAETRPHPNGQPHYTGAFQPYSKPGKSGRILKGQLPCTAAVMRCNPDGSQLELVAWGLRNPYGLGFLPDGRLLALDLGMNDRGSRPVGNVPDCLFEVKQDAWYGWPDYAAGIPVTDPLYRPVRGQAPSFLLKNHHRLPRPEQPLVIFPIHGAPVKFAVFPEGPFQGQLAVSLFGDKLPFTGPPGEPVGRFLVRVNPYSGHIHPLLPPGVLHRPIDVCFHPRTGDLLALDFGEFEMKACQAVSARPQSGKIHQIEKAAIWAGAEAVAH